MTTATLHRLGTLAMVTMPALVPIHAGWVVGGAGYVLIMPRPTSDADAAAEMLAVGWEPQERYPGKTRIPWLVKCVTCGRVSPKRLDTVRRNGQQCGYCAGKKTDPQAALMEMLAAGITPSVPYPGVDEHWPGTCHTCRRTVAPTLSNVRRNGSGCKYCARTAVDPIEAAVFMQSKGLRPTVPYPNSHAPWPCVCESCGRTVKHSYSDVKAGRRCSHTDSGRRVDPDEAAEFMTSRGLIPTVAFPGAKPQWPCICAVCGNAVTPRYSHVRKGVGCPFCAGKGRDPKGNEALVRSKGFTPLEPFVNLRTSWLCECGACGEAVRIWVVNLRRGHGCPSCTGRYPDAAKAEADMLAHGLRPQVPYPGRSNAPWPAECIARGHKVSPRLANLRSRPGTGCAYCVGKAVDLAEAEKFMASKGWEPQDKFPGVRGKWRCRCSRCGNISTPTYKAAKRGHGCRFCNKQGIDYAGPGYVYVIVNSRRGAVKIGIFGRRAQRDRTAIMRSAGWKTFNILPCPTGERARLIEQAVLQHLRDDLGLRPYLTNHDMPQNGGTETFSEDDINALELWRLVLAKSMQEAPDSQQSDNERPSPEPDAGAVA